MSIGPAVTSFDSRLDQSIASGMTAIFSGVFYDENDLPIPASDFDSLVLSINDTETGEVINSVDELDILNAGRGVVDSQGRLTITLESDDTVLPVGSKRTKSRSLTVKWTYRTDRTGSHQIDFKITRLVGDSSP
jgi:hypothetical protein